MYLVLLVVLIMGQLGCNILHLHSLLRTTAECRHRHRPSSYVGDWSRVVFQEMKEIGFHKISRWTNLNLSPIWAMAVITVTWVTLGYQLPCCPHYERLAPGLAASVVLLLPSEMFPVSGPWASGGQATLVLGGQHTARAHSINSLEYLIRALCMGLQ